MNGELTLKIEKGMLMLIVSGGLVLLFVLCDLFFWTANLKAFAVILVIFLMFFIHAVYTIQLGWKRE